MKELIDAISEYAEAARSAYRALERLHGPKLRTRGVPRQGCGRLDHRRIVWRLHGAGAYVRISGSKGVDFDFRTSPAGEIRGTIFHVAMFADIDPPTGEQASALIVPGLRVDPTGDVFISLDPPTPER
jgi:hypothetical protein